MQSTSIFFVILTISLLILFLHLLKIKDNSKKIPSELPPKKYKKAMENPQKFFLDQLTKWEKDDKKNHPVYGLHWGDPDKNPILKIIIKKFIIPYINPNLVALEIGGGGGRWTKHLLGFKRLYEVDRYQEILNELKNNYNKDNLVYIKNNGTDFPGIPEKSIDYIFSYGCFVHLDIDIINKYLKSISKIVHKNSIICIQYSDNNKELGRNWSFSNNNPKIMRKLVKNNGYKIIDEDTVNLGNSSVILFKLKSNWYDLIFN